MEVLLGVCWFVVDDFVVMILPFTLFIRMSVGSW